VITPRNVAVSLLACAAVTALASWLLDLSAQRAIALAPLFVLFAGAIAGVLMLWTRVALEQYRGREHEKSRTRHE
jgi:hypothetical protein